MSADVYKSMPKQYELESKLRTMSKFESMGIVLIPLLSFSLYFIFYYYEFYFFSLLSVMYLSFATYGSCSHELVHENTIFSRRLSHHFLSLIELLMLRSGTVYKHVHINHHQKYPNFLQDPEGQASYFSFFRTLLEGPILHFKLILWCYRNKKQRLRVSIELLLVVIFIITGLLLFKVYPALLIYQILVYMGSWIIPLITSYLVHLPEGKSPIYQTRLYRGLIFRILAFDHLYHLEHHLYPKIPHQRWPQLAEYLNPYFEKAGIRPRRLGLDKNDLFKLN